MGMVGGLLVDSFQADLRSFHSWDSVHVRGFSGTIKEMPNCLLETALASVLEYCEELTIVGNQPSMKLSW